MNIEDCDISLASVTFKEAANLMAAVSRRQTRSSISVSKAEFSSCVYILALTIYKAKHLYISIAI